MTRPSKPFLDSFQLGLTDPDEAIAYVKAALDDSSEMGLVALLDVVQAHQVSAVAKESGISREHIYRSLALNGNPRYKTLNALLNTIGLEFDVKRKSPKKAADNNRKNISTGYRVRREIAAKSTEPQQMLLPLSSSQAATSDIAPVPKSSGVGIRFDTSIIEQREETSWTNYLKQAAECSINSPMTLLHGTQTTRSSSQAYTI